MRRAPKACLTNASGWALAYGDEHRHLRGSETVRTRGQVESSLAWLERSGEGQQQLNLAVGRQRYKEI
jgi:hypothetical protein